MQQQESSSMRGYICKFNKQAGKKSTQCLIFINSCKISASQTTVKCQNTLQQESELTLPFTIYNKCVYIYRMLDAVQ